MQLGLNNDSTGDSDTEFTDNLVVKELSRQILQQI